VDYSEEFHATNEVFTTYRRSKATDSIAHAHMKHPKMKLKAEHAIEDDERAECGEAHSRAQQELQQAEDKKRLQEVYNSSVDEHTTFNFVKIHLMLHFEESVERFGHLVKDSTETHEMNHPKMCRGPRLRSNSNFRYEWHILEDYSFIQFLWKRRLHLWPVGYGRPLDPRNLGGTSVILTKGSHCCQQMQP
jgi:hypothetical protein